MTCLSAVVPSFSSIKYDFSPLFFVRVPSFDLPCIRRWWGWQVIALHGILFVLNVQHVPKKSLNIHTQRHTNTQTCVNSGTPIDLMLVIWNVCLPIAHRFGCIDSLSLLSFCHVRVYGTCLFVVFNHPTSSFHLSESARTHAHTHHSISFLWQKPKSVKRFQSQKLYRLNIQISVQL